MGDHSAYYREYFGTLPLGQHWPEFSSYTGMRHHTPTWDRIFGLAGGAGGLSSTTGGSIPPGSTTYVENIIVTTGQTVEFIPTVSARIARVRVVFNCQGGNAKVVLGAPPAHMSQLTVELSDRTFRDIGAVQIQYGGGIHEITNLFYPGDRIVFDISDTGLYFLNAQRQFIEFATIFNVGQTFDRPGTATSDMRTEAGVITVIEAPGMENDLCVRLQAETFYVTNTLTSTAMDPIFFTITFQSTTDITAGALFNRQLTMSTGAQTGEQAVVVSHTSTGSGPNQDQAPWTIVLTLQTDFTSLTPMFGLFFGAQPGDQFTLPLPEPKGNWFARMPVHPHASGGILTISIKVLINETAGFKQPPIGVLAGEPTGCSIALKQSVGDIQITEFKYTPSTGFQFIFKTPNGNFAQNITAADGWIDLQWVLYIANQQGAAYMNGTLIHRFFIDHYDDLTGGNNNFADYVDRIVIQSLEGGTILFKDLVVEFKAASSNQTSL